MKFIRYGVLKAYDHPTWNTGESDHLPPCRYGMYAFPYGFRDSFYLFNLKIAVEVKAGTPWRGEAFLAPFAPVSRLAAP